MAKYKGATKAVKIKKTIFPKKTGKLVTGEDVTLGHNKNTDRYDLRVNDRLRYSGIHTACLRAATEIGVDWDEQQ